ncbi:MAG: penicillin acylase family protein [Gemmataceae bacterium]
MSQPSSLDILHRLGRGERIADLCKSLNWSRPQFDAWWQDEAKKRLPAMTGERRLPGLTTATRIGRDDWGIPHIHAGDERDLFFAFGYATAQDRLFQLDFSRRKALGRLAEILGPEAVESDTLYRTIDLPGIAEREWTSLPRDVKDALSAYTAGVNAFLDDRANPLPIEFDLLDYRPEPWKPTDSLAILGEFRWYLTGRFPVICIPELVKRAVGDGALYKSFIEAELDEESILQPGEYPASRHAKPETVGGIDGPGSNNWVLGGARTISGRPIVASDPHIPFAAVSIWQEVLLDGGPYRVVGVALAGTPAVMIGRNENVAWGITNNICSQRDLYMEKIDPAHPGHFLYIDGWEKARERLETINVRGAEPVKKTVRSSRNGPIVDDLLPTPAQGLGPISLRWLGFETCGWLTAMLGMNRAKNVTDFRAATRPWLVPTFSLVYADRDGHFGYHAAGRIPLRDVAERGFRPGWDPRHQWTGVIPFDDMPRLADPARGYVATANNRVAPPDFPYPLAGCWSSGYRHRRCREMIGSKDRLSPEDNAKFQLDCLSHRATSGVPPLVDAIRSDKDPAVQQAVHYLEKWDCRTQAGSVAAALFNVFFTQWAKRLCRERFPAPQADFIAGIAYGPAGRLLHDDPHGWFLNSDRKQAIREAFRAALGELRERIGPDMDGWAWGEVHHLLQKHFLSSRGDLGVLLDRSGLPCDGDSASICSGQADAQHMSALGAGFRMVADLADPNAGISAVEIAGSSGHPGSPHYDDQIEAWSEDKRHYLALNGAPTEKEVMRLTPG